MLYLLLAILCSTCLLLIFKLLQRNNIEKLPVIIVNYFTAAAIGAIVTPGKISFGYFAAQSWFPLAVLLGFFFITVFYMVALSTQVSGIAVTSVAFKISLVIPVAAAYFLYHDKFGWLKVAGIVSALIAIVLTSRSEGSSASGAKGLGLFLPAIVFIGSGICDTMFNYIQNRHLQESDFSSFLIILFLTAGAAGSLLVLLRIITKKEKIQPKAMLSGLVLGIPNYGSAYFMILALEYSGIEPSALWPLNNIGIILLSTLIAAFFFNEKIGKYGLAGIVMAVASIMLIAASG